MPNPEVISPVPGRGNLPPGESFDALGEGEGTSHTVCVRVGCRGPLQDPGAYVAAMERGAKGVSVVSLFCLYVRVMPIILYVVLGLLPG